MPMDPGDEIRAVFRAEALEMLREMAAEVDLLPSLTGTDRHEALRAFMRHAHNLKGAAGMVGCEDIESLAHAIEGAMSPHAKADTSPDEQLLVVMDETVGVMGRLVEGESMPEVVQEMLVELATRTPSAPGSVTVTTAPASASVALSTPTISDDHGQQPSPPHSAGGKAADASKPKGGVVQGSIRIDTARLDRLMAYAGELLVAKSRQAGFSTEMARFHERFSRAFVEGKLDRDPEWALLAHDLDCLVHRDGEGRLALVHLSDEISLAMKRLRMLPLRDMESVWRRVVVDTATKLNKEVDLVFELGEIELDRYVLDGLRDPFMHFLRNAVDHGVESPEERLAVGKPRVGRVLIRSSLVGGMVRLEISDDGRGLDRQRIGEAAVERGLASGDALQQMQTSDVYAMLFLPGFSTAKKVSRISGRGVGLDVVKRRIEDLGGFIEIASESTLGGATFVLTLPVSLLSSKGLLVRVGRATYVLPTDSVKLTRRVDVRATRQMAGKLVTEEAGQPLRLTYLGDLVGDGTKTDQGKIPVVVVIRGAEQLGVIVDEVLQEQELVTKRLPWNLRRVRGVNGAVVLADGSVAVSVDVGCLFEMGHHAGAGAPASSGVSAATPKNIRILVVEDSVTARLELTHILAKTSYQVITAADGEEGWTRLESGSFDLVITDIQMPRLDGLGLTRRIRQSASYKDMPVVLVTSLASPDDIAEGAAAGANEYLIKGKYTPQDLLTAIERLV